MKAFLENTGKSAISYKSYTNENLDINALVLEKNREICLEFQLVVCSEFPPI